jgi:amino acid permease
VESNSRNAPAWVTWLLIVAGVACVAVAVVYFARPASQLPSFFPGHDAALSRHHTTHGIGMLVLAALCWVGAWFTTGASTSRSDS